MKVNDFITKLKKLATETKTVYALGMWGQPINQNIINSKTKQLPKWYSDSKIKMLTKLIGSGTFGFDCVCMIKSILWGFDFDTSKSAGGAKYTANNVPDMGADSLMNYCNDVSTDFTNIIPGEAVWIKGHVGVYIGDGMVVECTPKWKNAVQITYLKNLGYEDGNSRKWTKHGKLKFVDYTKEEVKKISVSMTEKEMWDALMKEFNNAFGVAGLMGNLYAECGLNPKNLQNNGNKKLNITDDEFTAKLDNGTYTKETFIKDGYGYGLAQWTYWSRKQNFYDFMLSKNASFGCCKTQIEFLIKELKGYKTVYNTLMNAKSVREASDIVLLQFERPADQSEAVQIKRCNYGQVYYDKYVGKTETKPNKKSNEEIAKEVIKGLWGNGATRKQKLTAAGYSYEAVQKIVNQLMKKTTEEKENYIKHVVVKGDTLWGIAKKYLGSGPKYTQIKKDNNLKSDTIYVGQVLKIYK